MLTHVTQPAGERFLFTVVQGSHHLLGTLTKMRGFSDIREASNKRLVNVALDSDEIGTKG